MLVTAMPEMKSKYRRPSFAIIQQPFRPLNDHAHRFVGCLSQIAQELLFQRLQILHRFFTSPLGCELRVQGFETSSQFWNQL
jgi:hypothetical protein